MFVCKVEFVRQEMKCLERGCDLKELPRDAESMNLDICEIFISDQEALELINVLRTDSGPVQVEKLVLSSNEYLDRNRENSRG